MRAANGAGVRLKVRPVVAIPMRARGTRLGPSREREGKRCLRVPRWNRSFSRPSAASLAALKAFRIALGRAIRAANGAGVRQNDAQRERSAAVLDVTGAPPCAFGDAESHAPARTLILARPSACFTRGLEEAAGVACGAESVWANIQGGLALATRPGEEPRRAQCLSVTKTPGIRRTATAVNQEAPRLGRRVQPEAQQRGSGPAQGFSYETRLFRLESWPASGSALGKPSVAASCPSGAAAAGTGP
jgi:hypothetical protein